MADEQQEGGNRATVAMVYRAVDDLGKLTEAHFINVNTRLDALSGIPAKVDALESIAQGYGTRIEALEQASVRQANEIANKKTWRITTLPSLFIGAVGVAFAALNIYLIVTA